jgi:hypothetical protein
LIEELRTGIQGGGKGYFIARAGNGIPLKQGCLPGLDGKTENSGKDRRI